MCECCEKVRRKWFILDHFGFIQIYSIANPRQAGRQKSSPGQLIDPRLHLVPMLCFIEGNPGIWWNRTLFWDKLVQSIIMNFQREAKGMVKSVNEILILLYVHFGTESRRTVKFIQIGEWFGTTIEAGNYVMDPAHFCSIQVRRNAFHQINKVQGAYGS